MTAVERKRLGKHWKLMGDAVDKVGKKYQDNHIGFKAYYEEFQSQIDAEIAAGDFR